MAAHIAPFTARITAFRMAAHIALVTTRITAFCMKGSSRERLIGNGLVLGCLGCGRAFCKMSFTPSCPDSYV